MSTAGPNQDRAQDRLEDVRVHTAAPGSGELSVTSGVVYVTDPGAAAEMNRRLADALLELLEWARETGLLPPPEVAS
jgi:hypothetical protein